MKTQRILSAFFLFAIAVTTLADEKWIAPQKEILPEAKIFPDSISQSQWLWFQTDKIQENCDCYYRKTLIVPEKVKYAEIIAYLDDYGNFYLNGRVIPGIVSFPQKNLQMRAMKFSLTEVLKKGDNQLAFHVLNGKYSGGLLFLGKIEYENGKIQYFHSDASWKAASKNQAKEDWFQNGYDDSAWNAAKSFGDVRTMPWIDATDILNLCTTPAEKEAINQNIIKATELPAGLAAEPDSKLKITWKNDAPAFSLGDQEFPPVIFPTSGLISSISCNDGLLKIAKTGVRVIEYAVESKDLEIGYEQYDLSKVNRDVSRILNLYPDALISINIFFTSIDHWLAKHPDEMVGYATGPADNQLSKLWHSLEVGGRARRPSYASKAFRLELERFVDQFCTHLKKMPWYKRLVMIRTSYGVYAEWHYFGMGGQMPDTGKPMARAFRDFLREKYKTDDALKKAWHDDNVTIETAIVPNVKERYGEYHFLRNPATVEQKVMDYYVCHQNVIADTLLQMAGAVKRNMPKMLVGAYYGYVFGMGNFPSEGQTLALEKVLSSPNIDFLSSPYDYNPGSRYMGGVGLPRMVPETFRRYRKLALNELDIRTHLAPANQFNNVRTPEASAQIFLRDMVICAMSGIGAHLTEMSKADGPKYFNDPEVYSAIHKCLNLWPDIRNAKKASENKIVVVFSPRELVLHGYPIVTMQQFNMSLGDYSLHALYRSGFSFDLLSLEDYLKSTKRYQVQVFLNAFTLSDQEREKIASRAKNKGTTTIWIYAPGLVSPQGYSNKAMEDLTGIKLNYSLEKSPVFLKMQDGKILGNMTLNESPRVFVDDRNAEILGKYDNAMVGMARKKIASGAFSVFSGVPVTSPEVWNKLFGEAGIKALTSHGIFVKEASPYLLVHVGGKGNYKITLPEKALRVESVFEGTSVGQNTDTIQLSSSDGKTWLLKIEE